MKITKAIVIALITISTISSSVCVSSIEPKLTHPTKINKQLYKNTIHFNEWLKWVEYCSNLYNVDKCIALALAETESSLGKTKYRFGWISRTYCGPYGIHKCYGKKPYYWDIVDPYENTKIGIRALAHHIKKRGSLKKALKVYNTHFNMRYYNRIMELAKINRKNKIFYQKYPNNLVYQINKL
jgi:hypothetical protein